MGIILGYSRQHFASAVTPVCVYTTTEPVTFRVLLCDPRHGTSPGGKEGRHQKHTAILPYLPIYLWENTVNKLFTAVTSSWTPAHGRSTVVGPTGRQGPSGRSPAVGTYEGWVTSYGVCGHLLDSLSAWGHSATLFKPEQAHFGRFYGIMFFRQDSLKSEGRCHTHLRINTRPAIHG